MRCGGGGGIRTPADRYQPGLFSRQLRSTTPAPLRCAVYRMRRVRSGRREKVRAAAEIRMQHGGELDAPVWLRPVLQQRRQDARDGEA